MKLSSQYLRSAPGQLTLFGIVFACAVVLAVVIVCLRGVVFERFARETYSTAEGSVLDTARALADPATTPERLTEIGTQFEERVRPVGTQAGPGMRELESIYGSWMLDEALDPAGHLARRLTGMQPEWVFRRLRTTLVAGTSAQQARALVWLRFVAGEVDHRTRVNELATYTQRKAARRGEQELEQQADAVLALACPPGDSR